MQKGSGELWGCELALRKQYSIATGGFKLALFTWHGCVKWKFAIDRSDETDSNIAYINTHAQLEALRDEAALAGAGQGPRVMIVGPPESGKSSLAQTLIGCATKMGRTPLLADLDQLDNALSVPGTSAVAPVTSSGITVEKYAVKCGIPPNTGVHPLMVYGIWFQHQIASRPVFGKVDKLAHNISQRLQDEGNGRYSGFIVNI
jgi:polyribonucleotide 5'-hydroxyl-kinase